MEITRNSQFVRLFAVSCLTVLLVAAPAMADDNGGGESSDATPSASAAADDFGSKLQNDYRDRMENARNNRDYRNMMLGRESEASDTQTQSEPPDSENGNSEDVGVPGMMRGENNDRLGSTTEDRGAEHPVRFATPFIRRFASSTDFASSTFRQQADEERGHAEEMRAAAFAWIQNNLADQLNRALDNLKQIRGRIADRIQTETSAGRDMSQAQTLLNAADIKIAAAEQAIQAVADYQPSATSSQYITASTTVGVGQARTIGADAIQAVKDARNALVQVVIAIAQAMGLDLGGGNSGGSPSPMATSTSTTTGQ